MCWLSMPGFSLQEVLVCIPVNSYYRRSKSGMLLYYKSNTKGFVK
jgi:hypothetical protein